MNETTLNEKTDFLRKMPDFFAQKTVDLSDTELRRKPSPDEFSFIEHIWHLFDVENEGYRVRIGEILSEEHPLLEDIDGGRLASERHYNTLDFGDGLAKFAEARANNLSILENLSNEQLRRTGTFDHNSSLTLEGLIEMMCRHDRDHRQDIETLLR